MKKAIMILLAAALLTGCGQIDESSTAVSAPGAQEVTGASEEVTETVTGEQTEKAAEMTTAAPSESVPETTAVTAAVTEKSAEIAPPAETETDAAPEEETPTEAAEPETSSATEAPTAEEVSRSEVFDAYRAVIEGRYALAADYAAGAEGSVTFSLYDMDKDGIPELLLKYGTCEADYMTDIYTYRSGEALALDAGLPGGHTSFGYDYAADQAVLIQGHMGYGNMSWYDIDDGGYLRFLIDTGGFEFGADGDDDFESFMKKYNVAWLPGCEFFGDDITWTWSYPDGVYTSEESPGHDYSFLKEALT